MAKTFVLTFIANDRPGLVDSISQTVEEQGGNWLESRMANLAGKFAGVVTVSVGDAQQSSLLEALNGLEAQGFHLQIEEIERSSHSSTGRLLFLDLVGPDHPGILHEITHCLAENRVSVEDMQTFIETAPVGGGTLFRAIAQVRLPEALDEEQLSEALEELANALMVDVSLGDLEEEH